MMSVIWDQGDFITSDEHGRTVADKYRVRGTNFGYNNFMSSTQGTKNVQLCLLMTMKNISPKEINGDDLMFCS